MTLSSVGMISGDNRTSVQELLDWAEELDLAVISVEYRLAPETQHPGPAEDCYAGSVWTPSTPTNSASTRRASSSQEPAPEVDSRLQSR